MCTCRIRAISAGIVRRRSSAMFPKQSGLARGAGVTGMVFTTWLGVFCDTAEEVDAANRDALELYGTMPEYLYPGAVIHPRAVETSLAWLDRFRERGLVWVGELVPYRCGIDFDRPEWTPLFERCRDNGRLCSCTTPPVSLRLRNGCRS